MAGLFFFLHFFGFLFWEGVVIWVCCNQQETIVCCHMCILSVHFFTMGDCVCICAGFDHVCWFCFLHERCH